MNDAPATLPRSLVESLPSSIGIAKSVDLMKVALATLDREMKKACQSDVTRAARAFVVLHRLKDKMEDLDKTWTAMFDRYKKEVMPELIEESGQDFIPLAEGFRVGTRGDFRASIREGKREEAFAWLKKHELGNLITDTVNSSSLSAAAKYEIEENNVDFPTDLFNVAIVPTTSVTKTK